MSQTRDHAWTQPEHGLEVANPQHSSQYSQIPGNSGLEVLDVPRPQENKPTPNPSNVHMTPKGEQRHPGRGWLIPALIAASIAAVVTGGAVGGGLGASLASCKNSLK